MTITFDVLEVLTYILIASVAAFLLSGSVFVYGIPRYDDALMRHWLREHAGETHDQDSGAMHATHLAWNALARLELILREAEKQKE